MKVSKVLFIFCNIFPLVFYLPLFLLIRKLLLLWQLQIRFLWIEFYNFELENRKIANELRKSGKLVSAMNKSEVLQIFHQQFERKSNWKRMHRWWPKSELPFCVGVCVCVLPKTILQPLKIVSPGRPQYKFDGQLNLIPEMPWICHGIPAETDTFGQQFNYHFWALIRGKCEKHFIFSSNFPQWNERGNEMNHSHGSLQLSSHL